MKTLVFAALIASLTTPVFADDAKLKKSCLKKYPIMQGIYDLELIKMFDDICDKKNKDNQNAYLIQAVQRLHQLGFTYQALQLIGSLEAQGVNHEQLTKIKFLIATRFSDDALKIMQAKQSHFLAEPPIIQAAISLNTNLQQVFVAHVEEEKVEKAQQVEEKKLRQPIKRARAKVQIKKPTSLTTPVNQTQAKQRTPFTDL